MLILIDCEVKLRNAALEYSFGGGDEDLKLDLRLRRTKYYIILINLNKTLVVFHTKRYNVKR